MSTNNNNKPQKITPFRNFCVQNFPFIETVYQEIDNYNMWQALVKKMNEIISNENTLSDGFNKVINNFNELQNYVNSYFSNLDVQEEINNKLDQMVQDGTLNKIINQELLENINNQINDLQGNWKTNGQSCHISFDDVLFTCQDLINNQYNSLFDQPFLKLLKQLHEQYNACFSLYVFSSVFNNIQNTKYKNEFIQNANWLKIGFHALNDKEYISNISPEQFVKEYNDFIDSVRRICETGLVVDTIPRLGFYSCNLINGSMFSETKSPKIQGLLDLEYNLVKENRISYWNNEYTSQIIDFITFNNIINVPTYRTLLRLESSNNIINDLTSYNKNYMPSQIEIFTHEYVIYDGNNIQNSDKLISACQWANNNNIPFNFLQNKYNNFKLNSTRYQNNYSYGILNNQSSTINIKENFNFLNKNYIWYKNGNLIYNTQNNTLSSNLVYSKNMNNLKITNNTNTNLKIQLLMFKSFIALDQNQNIDSKYYTDNWTLINANSSINLTLSENVKMLALDLRKEDETDFDDSAYQSILNNVIFNLQKNN